MGLLDEYDATPEQDRAAKVKGWLRTSWRELFAELREQRPVLLVPSPERPELVLVTTYRDVVEVLSHEREFSVRPYRGPMEQVLDGPFMLSRDASSVNWHERGVMQAVLSTGDLPQVRSLAGRFTDEALDAAASRGRVDLVHEVGRAVPLRLCADHFGFVGPDDATVRRWSRDVQVAMFRNLRGDPALQAAAVRAGAEMREHLAGLLERRRADLRRAQSVGRDPAEVAPDVLGRLLRLRLPDELALDDDRLVANVVGLLVGSVETTSQAVVQIVDLLLRDDALRRRATEAAAGPDRAAFDRLVWEALRFDPVNVLLVRWCEQPYELGRGSGAPVVLPPGLVLACTASALFDEAALADPDVFDPDRPSRLDLHFGYGAHACLGRHLGEQVVPEIVRRVLLRPGLSLLPGPQGELDRSGALPERFVVALAPPGPAAELRAVPPAEQEPLSGRHTDRDGLRNTAELWLLTHGAPVWAGLQRSTLLQRGVNKVLIDRAALRMPPRPNPLSTLSDYPSWPSLTDRRFDARHLPPTTTVRREPDLDAVTALFAREPGRERRSPWSTLLFTYFAQWFTDGFLRSAPGHVGQNETSHEIDLSQLYGRTPEATQALRTGEGGLLRSELVGQEELPPRLCEDGLIKPEFDALTVVRFGTLSRSQRDTLLALGSDRAHTLAGMTMINVLFLREHNRIARLLAAAHPRWDDDRLFQAARNTLTVVLLRIVLEDYVNHLTPYHFQLRLDPRALRNPRWYRTNRVAIEFNLLYRWHSLVPSRLTVGGRDRPLPECIADIAPVPERGLGALFVEASAQAAGRIGLHNTDAFLLETERASLHQGREVRLQPYNAYRRLCGFPPVTCVEQITGDPRVQEELRALYPGGVDDIELYVGLFAEDPRPGSPLGPLMGRMVGVDALSQALTNPLLSRQVYGWDAFGEGLSVIRQTSRLVDVLRRNVPAGTADGWVSLTRAQAAEASRR